MRLQRINFYIGLLLLVTAFMSSACSFSDINAQDPNEAARQETPIPTPSPTPAYKKPKRVSKDVIISDEKETKATKVKAKTK